jgi:hypothetical protein
MDSTSRFVFGYCEAGSTTRSYSGDGRHLGSNGYFHWNPVPKGVTTSQDSFKLEIEMAKLRVPVSRPRTGAAGDAGDRNVGSLRMDSDREASNRAFMARFVGRFRETLRELSTK